MTQCLSEGALRAYLDRELSPEDIQRAAAHLKECTVCDGLCRELAARAARVAEMVDLLPELESETLQLPARLPHRVSARPRVGWVGAAVALAAGLGVAAYLVPQRQSGPVVVVTAPPPAPAANTAVSAPVRAPVMAVRQARNPARTATKTELDAGDFVALDDEPFESGVIMRVAITPGKAQADIVFGPDGRARAFRLVKAPQQKF
jgi:anti-sigma factor RsiW